MAEYPSGSLMDYPSAINGSGYGCSDDSTDDLTNFTPIIILITFVVGVIGNGSLIAISVLHKDMRTPPSLLIVNMSLGDLMMLLFVVPDLIGFYMTGGWTMPLLICKAMKSSQLISQGVSVLTFVALSYDRYEVIARPFTRRHGAWRHAGMRILSIAASIWFISFLFSLPVMIWAYLDDCGACRLPFQENEMKYYLLVMFISVYLLPFAAVFMFYTLTALVLVRDTGEIRGSMRGAADRRRNSRTRLAFVILLAAVLFALLWLPYYIASLVFEFVPEDYMPIFFAKNQFMFQLLDVSFICGLLSCCTNPILLYAVSSNYRRKLKMMLSGCPFLPKHSWSSTKSFTLMTMRTNSCGSNHRDSPRRQGSSLTSQGHREMVESQVSSLDKSRSLPN